MGSVIARWTGREARALREAQRMSMRDFAAHLGINESAVSSWESRGVNTKLRHETQAMLDTELNQATPEVVQRFELILQSTTPGTDQARATVRSEAVESRGFAELSGQRTALLLETLGITESDRGYRPDDEAVERFRLFLDSDAGAFVLTGRAGSGKTRLTQHLAAECRSRADFQLHACSMWRPATPDLAAEILRYGGSSTTGDDALLSLERASRSLTRPCVVVVDGIDSDEELGVVGRQIDAILRHVGPSLLRFLIVVRTPPEPDLSPYPVLAAASFGLGDAGPASYTLGAWSLAEARAMWDRDRGDDELVFAALPAPMRELVRVPLYMKLVREAGRVDGSAHGVTAFDLVERCVRELVSDAGHPDQHVLGELIDLACGLMPDAIPRALPHGGPHERRSGRDGAVLSGLPLVEVGADGPRFVHSIFCEYFLALHLVDEIQSLGRSAATIAVVNELAEKADRSAAVSGVFDFVVCSLGSTSPHLLDAIALAPAVALDTTLAMLLETSASQAIPLSHDVVRTCAERCIQTPSRRLSSALLSLPALAAALGDRYGTWVVGQLRVRGAQIWPDVARHIERALDIRISTRILEAIEPDHDEELAFVFVARHFDLFVSPGADSDDLLSQLLAHLDWRVRAGLADALVARRAVAPGLIDRVAATLVRDDDYKVRAAIARAVGLLDPDSGLRHLHTLLADRNWHVRECTLAGVLTGPRAPLPDPILAGIVTTTTTVDPSWSSPPASVTKLLTRIRLLNTEEHLDAPPICDTAAFGLLREVRSGWIDLSPSHEHRLLASALHSSHWLTVREARSLRERKPGQLGMPSAREQYRRRRGRRALQIALDVHSLDRALEITRVAAAAGAEFIEVGDPLIKRAGVDAIAAVKQAGPAAVIVAEMMSADWGRDQVELAAEAGADVVMLIGPASVASVSAAVSAATRLDVALVLDVPAHHTDPAWIRDMERAGIDGFVVTTNIDLGVGGHHPLATARVIRGHSRLPVAVSGGFSAAQDTFIDCDDWDIAILGRSVADAVSPADIAQELTATATKIHPQLGAL